MPFKRAYCLMPPSFIDVNIGFEQAQYIIYSWINSTLKICVQLTEGSLERDVTVKAGTEKTSNTTGIIAIEKT